MFVNSLYNSQVCAVLVSEENEDAIIVPPELAGKYCVAFDPLDGSSNIDCNVSTGTIFSVWEKKSDGPASVDDILRPGSEVILFIIYLFIIIYYSLTHHT
jgi:fructose-1,6-bisphosphatase I